MYLKLSYFWLSNWINVLYLGLYFTYNFGSYVLRWADILTYKMVSMYLGELIFSSTIWVIFKWADIIIYNMGLILVGWYSHPKSKQLREFHSVQLPVTSRAFSGLGRISRHKCRRLHSRNIRGSRPRATRFGKIGENRSADRRNLRQAKHLFREHSLTS